MIFVIIAIVLLAVLCFVYKVKIKWKSFFRKGFLPVRGDFGIYCYCGKQGTGKTYSVVEYLLDNRMDIVVFCNIAGIQNIDYFLFNGFEELVKLKQILDLDYKHMEFNELKKYIMDLGFDIHRTYKIISMLQELILHHKQLIFVYDEIFTELQKGSKISKEVMDFLCQMRKRKIIFLTTAQEWSEIPLTFRRFCRYEIDCKMINLIVFGILLKNFKDAENMKWSDEEQEHVAPLVSNTITKTRKWIANSYNTFLRISSVEVDAPSSGVVPPTIK